MNIKDYRNTNTCLSLERVTEKKSILDKEIRTRYKKTKIIYNRINNKHGIFFKEFAKIYNHKCAYCGASLKFTDIRLFEIDHYICESAFSKDIAGRAEAGKMENLTFSCYSCNRKKGNLHIENNYVAILNPDDNSIANVFFRDDDYYIKINDAYSEDDFVKLFYVKLLLMSEVRRLDFLLLEMDNLKEQLQTCNPELADKLSQCISSLLQKKNYVLI